MCSSIATYREQEPMAVVELLAVEGSEKRRRRRRQHEETDQQGGRVALVACLGTSRSRQARATRRKRDHEGKRTESHEEHMLVMPVVGDASERKQVWQRPLDGCAAPGQKRPKRIGKSRFEYPARRGRHLSCCPHDLCAQQRSQLQVYCGFRQRAQYLELADIEPVHAGRAPQLCADAR